MTKKRQIRVVEELVLPFGTGNINTRIIINNIPVTDVLNNIEADDVVDYFDLDELLENVPLREILDAKDCEMNDFIASMSADNVVDAYPDKDALLDTFDVNEVVESIGANTILREIDTSEIIVNKGINNILETIGIEKVNKWLKGREENPKKSKTVKPKVVKNTIRRPYSQ